jgi:hypothetical protein
MSSHVLSYEVCVITQTRIKPKSIRSMQLQLLLHMLEKFSFRCHRGSFRGLQIHNVVSEHDSMNHFVQLNIMRISMAWARQSIMYTECDKQLWLLFQALKYLPISSKHLHTPPCTIAANLVCC